MLSAKQFQSKPGGTVVIVDDDPIVRSLIADRITSIGGKALEAADGVSGLSIISRQPIDLALVDLEMPGLHGLDLVRCIRGLPRARHIPIVVITSRVDNKAVQESLAAGATAYLTKPLHWSTFSSYICHLLQLSTNAKLANVDPEGLRFATHSTLVSSAAALKRIAARLLLRSGNDETSTDLCQVSDQLTEAASRFIGERQPLPKSPDNDAKVPDASAANGG